jgi:hypothetical protein
MDASAARFGPGMDIGPRDWDAVLQWAEDVCRFTEAILTQKNVTTQGAPFTLRLSWLEPPVRCNCVLALPVFVVVNIMTQLLYSADDDELTDPSTTRRQQRLNDIINPIIGLSTYLVDRVLPAWSDISEPSLGITVKRMHQLRACVRAYGLWTLGHISLASAANAELYASMGMECKELLTGRDESKCLDAAQYFFEAREVLRRSVPDELPLQWGTLFKDSGISNYCAKDKLDLTCAGSLGEISKQQRRAKPDAPESIGWIKRCSTDYLFALGYYYANSGQREIAMACLCAASNNGARVKELIEECAHTLGTSAQRSTLPTSVESHTRMLRGSKALLKGKQPCEWGSDKHTDTHQGTKILLKPASKPSQPLITSESR